MGILKHAVLPYFALVHASIFAFLYVLGDRSEFSKMSGWPLGEGDEGELTPVASHLLGAMGAFHCALAFACVIGVVTEHSHFRGVVAIMEAMVWGLELYDVYVLEFPSYTFLAVNTLVAAVGLAVHAKEPGIFTKDHDKEKSS